jgi:hypothetical protein
MGLMAGISGHPVSNANKLIGKSTEENKEVLFDRPEFKKADDYISIKVDNPEFQPLLYMIITKIITYSRSDICRLTTSIVPRCMVKHTYFS